MKMKFDSPFIEFNITNELGQTVYSHRSEAIHTTLDVKALMRSLNEIKAEVLEALKD